jgi:hypothetical protein
MARNKKFMCMETCIVSLDDRGEMVRKRFKFGDFWLGQEALSHHFIELEPDEQDATPRDILARRLEDMGIQVLDDQQDQSLITIYHNYRVEKDQRDTKTKLMERAKEIGAKFHHMWDVAKLRSAIQDREAEMNASQYQKAAQG